MPIIPNGFGIGAPLLRAPAPTSTPSVVLTPVAQNVTYQGGPVPRAPKVYLVFWGRWWTSTKVVGRDGTFTYSPRQGQRYVQSFFAHIGTSTVEGVLNQYGAGTQHPPKLGRTYLDITHPVPARPTSAQIAGEARRAARALHVSVSAATTFVVLTPQGHVDPTMQSEWCGYHDIATLGTQSFPYISLPYLPAMAHCGRDAVNPPDQFGHGYFDGMSIIGIHEYAETQTDPLFTGWYDPSASEVGDKCAWDPSLGNVTLVGQFFAVQPVWSNATQSCVM